jgi:hypothetical protein
MRSFISAIQLTGNPDNWEVYEGLFSNNDYGKYNQFIKPPTWQDNML